ncbi:MAG: SelB domain-containing protein, partial [Candidatus Hermodarchaeia archaeon]|jgi:selenocysteine-specific elongation factor
VVAIRGDRYIIRRPSPGETLGGGVVVDPDPKRRHKRFDDNVIERLESLVGGTPEDILMQSMLASGIASVREVLDRSSLNPEVSEQALQTLLEDRLALLLDDDRENLAVTSLIAASAYWSQIKNRIGTEITNYQRLYPLRQGIPREELKSRLGFSAREFIAIIGKILSDGSFSEKLMRQNLPGVSPVPVIYQPGHVIQFSPSEQKLVDKLLSQFRSNPYSPPTIKTCITEVGEDMYNALIDTEQLMPVSNEVVFRLEDYDRMVTQVGDKIRESGSISVGNIRDLFNTSRRYILALLEHMDAIGITVRDGDVRRLKG